MRSVGVDFNLEMSSLFWTFRLYSPPLIIYSSALVLTPQAGLERCRVNMLGLCVAIMCSRDVIGNQN